MSVKDRRRERIQRKQKDKDKSGDKHQAKPYKRKKDIEWQYQTTAN
jgi:hypothetical protein